MPLRSFKEPHSAVATVASDQLDAASFGSRSFGLARLEKDVDAAKQTSNIYSSHRKEIVRIHGWLHTSGFALARPRISSKISPRLGGFHHHDPQKGVYIFDFFNPYPILPFFLSIREIIDFSRCRQENKQSLKFFFCVELTYLRQPRREPISEEALRLNWFEPYPLCFFILAPLALCSTVVSPMTFLL